jgi:FixJ family two-component response regulator
MIPCILNADDKKEILDSHRIIMKRYGFEVRYTARLKYMKKAVEADEIDCIHTDILFDSFADQPDWSKPNGLSEVSYILQGRSDIPVMVISAYIDAKAKQMAMEYGVSNAIYEWYSKPVDYDVIAFDTIKAINEKRCRYTKDMIVDYLRGLNIESIEKLESALTSMPPEKIEHIKLKPELLIDKLKRMCEKMLGDFKNFGTFRSTDFNFFKALITSHMCDYFSTVSLKHFELANYFVDAISRSKEESLKTLTSFSLIMEILKKFRQNKITDEEISKIRDKMQEIFKIYLRYPGYGVAKYKEMLRNWLSGSHA